MNPWLRFLIGFVVACHGFVYLFLLFVPEIFKNWRGRSWLMGNTVTGERLKSVATIVHVVAGILIMASGLAIALAAWIPGWWVPLAIAGSAVGLAAFAVFWDGQSQRLVDEGAIGVALSLILLALAVAVPGVFA